MKIGSEAKCQNCGKSFDHDGSLTSCPWCKADHNFENMSPSRPIFNGRAVKFWAASFCGIALLHFIRFNEIITHSSILVNDVSLLLLLSASFGLIWLAYKIETSLKKLAVGVSIGLAVLSGLRLIFLLLGMASEDYSKGTNPSFELIKTVPLGDCPRFR